MGSVSDTQIVGGLASHPCSAAFADVVRRVHHRYATEIVDAFRLCPFMKDPESAFGRFIVVLARDLDVELAANCVLEADVQVAHLIYPLTDAAPADFERFGNALHHNIASRSMGGPVHAAFHPQMAGKPTTAAKLVGLLRRAPDPFVQFIPEGLHVGGSTFIDVDKIDVASLVQAMPNQPPQNNAKHNFDRLSEQDLSRIQSTIASIHEDRNRSYAEFLAALACD